MGGAVGAGFRSWIGVVGASTLSATAALTGGLLELAHEDFGVLAGGDPEDVADFLALGSEFTTEFHLEGETAGEIPVVLVFHGAAIKGAPFEVGDIGQEDDFCERFLVG